MKKAQSRKLLVVNHFIAEGSRNKVAANKSWFTVINEFLIIRQNAHVIDLLKERYKAQILYVNNCGVSSIAMCIQCGLDTVLNLPFKLPFLIYKFILNTNERCPVLTSSSFVLHMIFSSMLSECLFLK
jgi:hypothetical protein